VNGIGAYDTMSLLEKALPVLEQSQRVLANNVANANTPGFTPTHVSFEESLSAAISAKKSGSLSLKTTHPGHMSSGAKPVGLVFERDVFEPGRNDGSKFNIDKEMVELLRNNGRFDIFSSILAKKYRQYREVLRST
jgi:flagellar basal-body rod protein FlgB